jgi:hypothetical protein
MVHFQPKSTAWSNFGKTWIPLTGQYDGQYAYPHGAAGPTLAYWLRVILLLLTVATARKVRNLPQIAVSVTARSPANF